MRRVLCPAMTCVCVIVLSGVATAESAARLIPPVDGPVGRPFDAPEGPYARGHRGIDYKVPAGTRIRAAGPGTVTFAGEVAGTGAVTIDHGLGVESTYSDLAEVAVVEGQRVDEGTWIGRSGEAHAGIDGLHFGVKIDGTYVDPGSMLGPVDVAEAVHLAPEMYVARDLGGIERLLAPVTSAGSSESGCDERASSAIGSQAPNHNIAVAVAGITSATSGKVSASIYRNGPETLGYPDDRVYRFSYRGTGGPRFHEPYRSEDTYADLWDAAARLRDLMAEIARRHRGARVDLIAHSQGGVVARAYLIRFARAWDPDLPPIDHLVTFATPHEGAPVAGERDELDERTLSGSSALDAASAWARAGGPIPDPRSDAVAQLAPGSGFLNALAREDIGFGTRALALAIPNDLVVPADRAHIPGETFRVVPPEGIVAAHSRIVTSEVARALAYSFLSDRRLACPSGWDEVGPGVGRIASYLQSHVADLYRAAEERTAAAALAALRIPPPVGRLIYRGAVAVKGLR